MLLVTNNDLVVEKWGSCHRVIQVAGGYGDVLTAVRDLVHKGHRLLSHPLAGSVKPNETPFRSIAVTERAGDEMDLNSLSLIEDALAAWHKFPPRPHRGDDAEASMRRDFAEIDLCLLGECLEKE